MDDVNEGIVLVSAAFTVLMGLWTALRLHKERPFSMPAVLLAGAGPVAALDAGRRCGQPGDTAWAAGRPASGRAQHPLCAPYPGLLPPSGDIRWPRRLAIMGPARSASALRSGSATAPHPTFCIERAKHQPDTE